MAGGGGSTGGIGAQSPAVNPPSPMGQIGNAVGGALGGMGGQPQNPMGGGNVIQTGEFGSQPIDMGGGVGGQPPSFTQPYMQGLGQAMQGGMAPGFGPAQQQMGFMNSLAGGQPFMGQPPMETPTMDSQIMDSMQQAQARQQTLSPSQMAEMQQAYQAARQPQGQMGLGQAAQTGALTQPQTAGLGGLAALLGGGQARPAPATAPNPGRPAPVATKPAPVAAKPVAKPSVVPPKTPPAVASAIQKLAAKKQAGRR
jgi:hypothetical protein